MSNSYSPGRTGGHKPGFWRKFCILAYKSGKKPGYRGLMRPGVPYLKSSVSPGMTCRESYRKDLRSRSFNFSLIADDRQSSTK
ncbi:hypothetical protein [Microcoleus sp.]|uniref:hypothetical protein n=1 Tax=Microcoleus sp. TaxID=44472 RepID=UPI0035948871